MDSPKQLWLTLRLNNQSLLWTLRYLQNLLSHQIRHWKRKHKYNFRIYCKPTNTPLSNNHLPSIQLSSRILKSNHSVTRTKYSMIYDKLLLRYANSYEACLKKSFFTLRLRAQWAVWQCVVFHHFCSCAAVFLLFSFREYQWRLLHMTRFYDTILPYLLAAKLSLKLDGRFCQWLNRKAEDSRSR